MMPVSIATGLVALCLAQPPNGTRKITVTDRAGAKIAGATLFLASGLQSTSTDSSGVAILREGSFSGGMRISSGGVGSISSLRLESNRLLPVIGGHDLFGRKSVQASPRPEAKIAARASSSTDTLLVGWNNVLRAKVPLNTELASISIDTAFVAHQPAWNDTLASSTITDSRDGHVYRITTIGRATWMAENLAWNAPGSNFFDGLSENGIRYGRHYSWCAAMSLSDSCNATNCSSLIGAQHRGACPAGWHIPSEADWDRLAEDVGGVEVAGTRLKAVDVQVDRHQTNGVPILKSADPYGFRAIFAGWRYSMGGMYASDGAGTAWWTTGAAPSDGDRDDGLLSGAARSLDYMNNSLMKSVFFPDQELSVRCVLDR